MSLVSTSITCWSYTLNRAMARRVFSRATNFPCSEECKLAFVQLRVLDTFLCQKKLHLAATYQIAESGNRSCNAEKNETYSMEVCAIFWPL